jgi:A/G-specific adenine glycosylase
MWSEAKHLSKNSAPHFFAPDQRGFDPSAFRAALLRWYRLNGRRLPWRETRDPYRILISEFLLQQTRVAAVQPYYNDWLRRFPDFESVARASESDVLRSWEGLGYYSRARNLRAAAKTITKKYRGHLPQGADKLYALPGIGRYTANAIASFAFDQSVPVVDANVTRVLARLFNFRKPIDTAAGRKAIWEKAALLLPKQRAREYNSALMDLGALVCVAHRPKCDCCPIRRFCRAKDPNSLPVKRLRPKLVRIAENHGFSFFRDRILLEKSRTRWRGMWILPRLAVPPLDQEPLHTSEFSFTHHRIRLVVFLYPHLSSAHNCSRNWFTVASLGSVPLPSPHRRALMHLLTALHLFKVDRTLRGRCQNKCGFAATF